MGGTARVKRLGATALLAVLLVPAPAGAAKKEQDSSKEWVWGKWEKDRDKERQERKQQLRREERDQRKDRYEPEPKDRSRAKYKYKYKYKYEAKYKYKFKYESRDTYERKHRDERRHDHHHGGYGLVYGRPGDYRPRPHPPRPHPCDSWFYNGRPYDPVGHHDDDEFLYWDDHWRHCGRPDSSWLDRRSTYVVHLTGDQATPPGPPDASGMANVLLNGWSNELCYLLSVKGATAIDAHLHEGRVGEVGPGILDLRLPGTGGRACMRIGRQDLNRIKANPGAYYIEVSTATHGAIRGQLVRAYGSDF